MRSMRLRWCSLILFALCALVSAGCGSGESADTTMKPETAREETTVTGTSTTNPAPEPVQGQLAGLTVVDENTFTVELVGSDPEFPLRLAYPAYFALPDSAFEDPAAQNEMPIGNGPFMMEGPWEHEVRIEAVRNPDYRGPDPPKVDAFVFDLDSDWDTASPEVLAGKLDVIRVPSESRESARLRFGENYEESGWAGIIHLSIPAYLDQYTEEHRQALSMAIDRDLLNEQAFKWSGTPAHGAIPPALGGRNDVCANWNHEPEKARALWDAAGGLDEITISWPGTSVENWLQLVVDMWTETLGVDPSTVNVEALEWGEFLARMDAGEATGLIASGWQQDYPSPLNFLEPIYASYNTPDQGGGNWAFYNNPGFDEALAAGMEKVAATGLLGDAVADYSVAEDILCEDAPVIPIQFGINQYAHSDNVGEVYVDSFGDVGYTVIEAGNGIVIAGDGGEPESLLSTNASEGGGTGVLRAINTGLVQFDPRNNEPFNAHARSITSTDGGENWTIVLKPGWTFHDGTPNDAASYVKAWSYGADAANDQKNNSHYRNIVGYDAVNPTVDG